MWDKHLGSVAGLGLALAFGHWGCGSPSAATSGSGGGGTAPTGAAAGEVMGGTASECNGAECGGAAGEGITGTPMAGDGGSPPACGADLETDPLNCGRCERVCAMGGTCEQGHCVESLAIGSGFGLATDEQHAYAMVYRTKMFNLLRVAHADGVAKVVATDERNAVAHGLALGPDNAYFAQSPSAGTVVYTAPKAGGAYEIFSQDMAGSMNGQADVATDGTHVYWIGYASIYRAPVAGGAAEHWATTCVGKQLAIAGGKLYWACGQVTGTSGAIVSKALSRAALDGASDSVVGANDFALGPFFVDGDRVYWAASFGGGGLRWVATSGGPVTTLPASGIRWISAMAFDADHIYIAGCPTATCDAGEHLLMRGTKSGDDWTLLAKLQAGPQAMALGGGYIYVSCASPAGLIRVSID